MHACSLEFCCNVKFHRPMYRVAHEMCSELLNTWAELNQTTLGDFTFWISLSLRPSLSPKYGLRPKISEKRSQFFGLDSVIAESKVWFQRFAETKH